MTNLDSKTTLICIGDSFCYGTGLAGATFQDKKRPTGLLKYSDHRAWPYFFQKNFLGLTAIHYKLDFLNLSIPGSSNDTIFRRLMQLLIVGEKLYSIDLDKSIVVVFWTGFSRREYYDIKNNKYVNTSPQWIKEEPHNYRKPFLTYYNEYFWSDEYDAHQTLIRQFSSQETLKNRNINYWQDHTVFEQPSQDILNHQAIDKTFFPSYYDPEESILRYHEGPKSICGHSLEPGHEAMSKKMIDNVGRIFGQPQTVFRKP